MVAPMRSATRGDRRANRGAAAVAGRRRAAAAGWPARRRSRAGRQRRRPVWPRDGRARPSSGRLPDVHDDPGPDRATRGDPRSAASAGASCWRAPPMRRDQPDASSPSLGSGDHRRRTAPRPDGGRNARPRISFGAPLPVGMAADGELIDVVLTERWPVWQVREALTSRCCPTAGDSSDLAGRLARRSPAGGSRGGGGLSDRAAGRGGARGAARAVRAACSWPRGGPDAERTKGGRRRATTCARWSSTSRVSRRATGLLGRPDAVPSRSSGTAGRRRWSLRSRRPRARPRRSATSSASGCSWRRTSWIEARLDQAPKKKKKKNIADRRRSAIFRKPTTPEKFPYRIPDGFHNPEPA